MLGCRARTASPIATAVSTAMQWFLGITAQPAMIGLSVCQIPRITTVAGSQSGELMPELNALDPFDHLEVEGRRLGTAQLNSRN